MAIPERLVRSDGHITLTRVRRGVVALVVRSRGGRAYRIEFDERELSVIMHTGQDLLFADLEPAAPASAAVQL